MKWSGFQTGLRFADGRRKSRLQRLPVPDRGQDPRQKGVSIWGRVRPGTGVRSVQLQKGGRQLGPAVKTNSLGYFDVKRAVSGSYRFKAYDKDGLLLGTSRSREADSRIGR